MRLIAVALTAAALFWTAAVLVTPLRLVQSPSIAAAARLAGAIVCHQRPERSFHTRGVQFPVCARCTGLYLSGAAGALVAWFGLARVPRRTRVLLGLAAAPTAVTVLVEWSGMAGPSNVVRAAAAVPLGATVGWLVVRMLRAESPPTASVMIS